MKTNLKLHRLVTFCITAVLGSIPNLSMAACSISSLAGNWSFSEQGTLTAPSGAYGGSWSEVGSITLDSSGTGSGTSVVTAPPNLVGIFVQINSLRVNYFNNQTCIGTASFIVNVNNVNSPPRTMAFTIISNSAFDYISTVGDLTTLGHATKRVNQNAQ